MQKLREGFCEWVKVLAICGIALFFIYDCVSFLMTTTWGKWSTIFGPWIILNAIIASFFAITFIRNKRGVTHNSTEDFISRHTIPILAAVVIFGFGFRLWASMEAGYKWDEEQYPLFAYLLYQYGLPIEYSRGNVQLWIHVVWYKLWFTIFPEGINPLPHSAMGLRHAQFFFTSRVLNVILTSLNIGWIYLIGRNLFDDKVGLLGSIFYAANRVVVLNIDSTALSEPLANFFILTSLVFYTYERKNSIFIFISGCMMGLAFGCRFPYAIVGGLLILYTLLRREWKRSLGLSVGFTLFALVEGLLESYAGVGFFATLLQFFEYNIYGVAYVAHRFGISPWYWYIEILPFVLGILLLPLILGINKDEQSKLLLFLTVPFFILFSMYPHKEMRFISYMFPLFMLIAARGMTSIGLKLRSSFVATKVLQDIIIAILW